MSNNGNGNGLPRRIPKPRGKKGRPKGSLTMKRPDVKYGRPIICDSSAVSKPVARKAKAYVEAQAEELAELILRQLKFIASSDIRLLPDCPKDIPDEIAYAISGLHVTKSVRTYKDGSVVESVHTKYMLWPKPDALNQIARHIGWFRADNAQTSPKLLQINQYNEFADTKLSDEQIEALRQLGIMQMNGDAVEIKMVGNE